MSQAFNKCKQVVNDLGNYDGKKLREKDEGYMFAFIDLFKTMCDMEYPWIHNEDGIKLHDLQELMRVIHNVYSEIDKKWISTIYLAWSEWDLEFREKTYQKRRTSRTQEEIDNYLRAVMGCGGGISKVDAEVLSKEMSSVDIDDQNEENKGKASAEISDE